MIGTSIAHYKVTGKLGAGGMGEVYRATDTKLGRDVALKVLPAAFAADAQRLARFQREAQVLAALNHPHIAAIYGLEDSGGSPVLAMELVEGPTLAERISGGALPLEEALALARQIAEALEFAHEKGIVHRDLKPVNVKVTPDGNVKVLDFGLAKALAEEASDSELANSPTLSMAATKAGIILGTAAYMSPEQARAKAVDRRTDVWSFGAVFFEMLAGRRAFSGEDASETLASVLRADPEWAALPQKTPRSVRRLLERCLERNPKRRLQAIGEARIALEDCLSGHATEEAASAHSKAPVSTVARWLPWAVTGALLVLVAGLAWRWAGGESGQYTAIPVSFSIDLPITERFGAMAVTDTVVAISNDGSRLAFSAVRDGIFRIHVRELGSTEMKAIPGTEGGGMPLFSPDGKWLTFVSNGMMKKVNLAGGSPLDITRSDWGAGYWAADDTMYFAPHYSAGLHRVSANGGQPEKLTEPDRARGELGHWWPNLLPDGKTLLFVAFASPIERARIMAYSLETKKLTVVLEGGTFPRYLPSGHLTFITDAGLMAVSFDPTTLQVKGPPVRVLEEAFYDPQDGLSFCAISQNGTMVYIPKATLFRGNEVVWVNRQGKTEALGLPQGYYKHPRLSPDGRRIALTKSPQERQDVWVFELDRSTMTSVAAGPTSEFNALWTSDGKRLIFNLEETQFEIYARAADGTGPITPLLKGTFDKTPSSLSPDGKVILFAEHTPDNGSDLWTLTLADGKAEVFLRTPAAEEGGVFSPDGRWIAYHSSASGRTEVYVQSFPKLGERFQISSDGGEAPLWSRKGDEIFYRANNRVMAVKVQTQGALRAERPVELFKGEYDVAYPGPNYDVTRDGRFLMVRTPPELAPRTAVVVVNWFEQLKKLVPTAKTNP